MLISTQPRRTRIFCSIETFDPNLIGYLYNVAEDYNTIAPPSGQKVPRVLRIEILCPTRHEGQYVAELIRLAERPAIDNFGDPVHLVGQYNFVVHACETPVAFLPEPLPRPLAELERKDAGKNPSPVK